MIVNGVRLHYLDWGGTGEALVFLNGWGDTAHIFDDIAPRFTDRFHVLGFTRRGYGLSDQPRTGYDPASLVEEIHGFLEAKKINRVTLAGHSMAGYLMTLFAARYPERVHKLVYLDAIQDYSSPDFTRMLNNAPPIMLPAPRPQDFASLDAYRRFLSRFLVAEKPLRSFWSPALEASLRDLTHISASGAVALRTPGETNKKWLQAFFGSCRTLPLDYSKVKAPALAFVAYNDTLDSLGAISTGAERERATAWQKTYVTAFRQAYTDRFRKEMTGERVIEIADTHHYCFLQRPEWVVREMRAFLLDKTR